jgi:hypothetical protein
MFLMVFCARITVWTDFSLRAKRLFNSTGVMSGSSIYTFRFSIRLSGIAECVSLDFSELALKIEERRAKET